MAPDLYVFDLDGTLVDSLPDIAVALNAALVSAGLPSRRLDEIRGFLGDGARDLVRRAAGPAPSETAIDELVERYRREYRKALVVHTRLYPGIDALLPALPRAAVLTNKPGPEARRIVEGVGIARHFVEVIGEGDGMPRKPDPAALRAIIDRANAARPIYVGDSAIDGETARRAGVDFVFVRWGYGALPEASRAIDRPEDLLRID